MVSNLAFLLHENLSLENLPRGEFKLFSLVAKCLLDIVCRTHESNIIARRTTKALCCSWIAGFGVRFLCCSWIRYSNADVQGQRFSKRLVKQIGDP
jgi:hypothetical protein